MFRSIISDKKADSVCTSKFVCLIGTLLFILAICIGTTLSATKAQAEDVVQAQGVNDWELDFGVGYMGRFHTSLADSEVPLYFDDGFTIMTTVGYRYSNRTSLNLDQSISTAYNNTNYSDSGYAIIGHTAVVAKISLRDRSENTDIYVKIGIGAQYGSFFEKNKNDMHYIMWYIPLGIGMTQFFNEKIGIGANMEWDSAILIDGIFKATLHLAIKL